MTYPNSDRHLNQSFLIKNLLVRKYHQKAFLIHGAFMPDNET
jgi:hypothetical protein